MTLLRTLQLKQKHPLWTWRQCASYALEEAKGELPWSDVFVAAVVVFLILALFAQLLHRFDSDNWVCSRATYAGVWVNGELVPATPCTEEINVKTGQTRVTKWGMK